MLPVLYFYMDPHSLKSVLILYTLNISMININETNTPLWNRRSVAIKNILDEKSNQQMHCTYLFNFYPLLGEKQSKKLNK
jgi:hypothetical protein